MQASQFDFGITVMEEAELKSNGLAMLVAVGQVGAVVEYARHTYPYPTNPKSDIYVPVYICTCVYVRV